MLRKQFRYHILVAKGPVLVHFLRPNYLVFVTKIWQRKLFAIKNSATKIFLVAKLSTISFLLLKFSLVKTFSYQNQGLLLLILWQLKLMFLIVLACEQVKVVRQLISSNRIFVRNLSLQPGRNQNTTSVVYKVAKWSIR